jgi:citrate synthase
MDECSFITDMILEAKAVAESETSSEPEPALTQSVEWPITCSVGPGLEGAIACESEVGYVNGAKGWLVYRGYDIFELAARCTFEEVAYLLVHGDLPNEQELKAFKARLLLYSYMPNTLRRMMSFPVESMHAMAALRLGTNMMRQEFTARDTKSSKPRLEDAIGSDEDSIPMETAPTGETHAIYEFDRPEGLHRSISTVQGEAYDASDLESCYHLIAGVSTLTAAIARLRKGSLPLEPDATLGHAANFLYMLTGRKPTPIEERLLDVTLILHADHGMNASTFAAMVVASTLSDIYLSIGSGIAALAGPLHGGANEKVIESLVEIGSVENVGAWYKKQRAEKQKIVGFGHRVYKAYDPRARILGPITQYLAEQNPAVRAQLDIATALEKLVIQDLGATKKIFPNVDFYSGLAFAALGITTDTFTSIFALSRVAGWTARVLEYLKRNRIFRPRAIYTGSFGRTVMSISER